MNAKILLVKALLLYRKDGMLYFLELIRSEKKKFALQGDLPGGKVENGESLTAAIKREVLEETGLVTNKLNLISVYHWNDDSQEYQEYLYCAIVNTQAVVLAPEEHCQFEWRAFNKIDKSAIHPNIKQILKNEETHILQYCEQFLEI